MSTYYNFYMFMKRKDKKLTYCGPYLKNEKIASIFEMCGDEHRLLDNAWQINEEQFEDYDIHHYFKVTHDKYFKNNVYMLYMDDLKNMSEDYYIQAYVHKHLMRQIELEKSDLNIGDYIYNGDLVISPTEYYQLDNNKKKEYVLYTYKNYDSINFKIHQLMTIIRNWYYTHVEYNSEFDNYTFDDIVIVIDYC